MDRGNAAPTTGGTSDFAASGAAALDHVADGVSRLRAALAEPPLRDAFNAAAQRLLAMEGRLICVGVGKSGHVAAKLAATFASTGTPSLFVHPSEASHGDLGMIVPGDIILALSWSGQTRELRDIIAYVNRFRVPLLAITSDGASMLGRAADVAMVAPQVREACPHDQAPTTSTAVQLALGDALAMALVEARGFTAHNLREFHPGGKIGVSVQSAASVMLRGDQLPVISQHGSVADAIQCISSSGCGIAGLLDDDGGLAGVITDGDLRRYMDQRVHETVDQALNTVPAWRIMTQQPVVVGEDVLVASVLSKMQEHRVSAIFVVDQPADGRAPRPLGIITFMHLLQLGVV